MQNENEAVVEASTEQNQNTIVQESAPQIKSEENLDNWKAVREQRKAEREARKVAEDKAKEKAAEAAALREALEAALSNSKNPQQPQQQEENEEARIDRRVREIIAEREKHYEKEVQQRELQEYPQKLRSVYSDFNKVCAAENLDYLEYHYPEIANAFRYMPEGFDKWSSIYKAVKKFVPNPDAKQDMMRAEKNLNKPGSVSSAGNTQGPSAMPSSRLDDSRKASNWERMQRTLKGLTS